MKVHGKSHIYDYIPDYAHNRKLSRDEQIVLKLKVVPLSEFDGYQRTCLANSKKFSADKSQELNEKRFHELIASKFVSCSGLEIEGHEGEITFETLYNEVPELASEVIKAVMSSEVLTEGEQKNF